MSTLDSPFTIENSTRSAVEMSQDVVEYSSISSVQTMSSLPSQSWEEMRSTKDFSDALSSITSSLNSNTLESLSEELEKD